MNEDFEIEIIDESNEKKSEVNLPVNFITVGSIENDDLRVYIKQDVFKNLEKFASSDVEHELGSILIGDFSDTMGKTNVIISEYIEAKYTDASASTLTFTHESWDYIHKEHEEKYPDLKILGWQHTHPGYGIFLSNYDMFIQENFFNLPFQIAYVIDPKQKIRGFFQWKNGKVEKLNGFYIYDEVGKPIKVDLSKNENRIETKQSKKTPSFITIALIVAVAILSMIVFNLSGQIKKQVSRQSDLESVLIQQNNKIYDIENQSQTESVDSTSIVSDPNVSFIQYKVKPGDTLYSICKEKNIDFNENINIIKSINGISDVNSIFVNQIIILPEYGSVNE